MRIISQQVATYLLIALCLLGGQAAMAAGVALTAVSGTVLSTGGKPVGALVYLNGKSVFANKTTGAFTLTGNPLVALFAGQTLALRVFATGYAPTVKSLTVTSTQFASGNFSGLKIAMQAVAPGKPLKVAATYKAAAEKGFFIVEGTVKDGTTPVCAVVWANGKAMRPCQAGSVGKFSLKGKLSAKGQVTLQVFPDTKTYKPYTFTTPDTDKDLTADFVDRDDDNDGVEDTLDACPLDPNPACKPVIPGFGTGTFDTLYVTGGTGLETGALKVNAYTGATIDSMLVPRVALPVGFMDLAFVNGQLYGTENYGSSLYRIDFKNKTTTLIGNTGVTALSGYARLFSTGGNLYLSDGIGKTFQLNLSTGFATPYFSGCGNAYTNNCLQGPITTDSGGNVWNLRSGSLDVYKVSSSGISKIATFPVSNPGGYLIYDLAFTKRGLMGITSTGGTLVIFDLFNEIIYGIAAVNPAINRLYPGITSGPP